MGQPRARHRDLARRPEALRGRPQGRRSDEAEAQAEEEEIGAAYDKEGEFADFIVHPAIGPEFEPVVVMHTPWDDDEDEPVTVSPEQAEAFALRVLQQATLARLAATGVLELLAEDDEDEDPDEDPPGFP